MIVIILVAVLVLGIALYQALQGLFSALIMTILTVLCAVAAFHLYEPFAGSLLYNRMPTYADGTALIALFVIPLLALRWAFDAHINGTVVLGMWPDRIGGGVLGLATGMVLVGVLMVALQMLPFGTHGMDVLGYHPFDDSLQRRRSLAPFYPDEFTVGLVNAAGGLQIAGGFAQAHDNLLLELFCARNTAGGYGGTHAKPGMLTVVGAYRLPDEKALEVSPWTVDLPPDPLLGPGASANTKVLIVRAALKEKDEEGSRDEDNWWRLCGTHFRLVTKAGRSHYPLGYLTYITEKQAKRRGQKQQWKLLPAPAPAKRRKGRKTQVARLHLHREWRRGQDTLAVDWVYRLPAEAKPAYLVFRRTAKDEITSVAAGMPPGEGALDRTN